MSVIAVDFDNTIAYNTKYPGVGSEVKHALASLTLLQKAGNKVIIWTVRSGSGLENAKKWFKENNFTPDGYNHLKGQDSYSTSPKLDYDYVIDEKAVGCPILNDGSVDWLSVMKFLKGKGEL